jgi:hypothetical protein
MSKWDKWFHYDLSLNYIRRKRITRTVTKRIIYINLLCLANQLGRKMSKLSFVESEYLRAIDVMGHDLLNISSTTPSSNMIPIQIHTHLSNLLVMTA